MYNNPVKVKNLF